MLQFRYFLNKKESPWVSSKYSGGGSNGKGEHNNWQLHEFIYEDLSRKLDERDSFYLYVPREYANSIKLKRVAFPVDNKNVFEQPTCSFAECFMARQLQSKTDIIQIGVSLSSELLY